MTPYLVGYYAAMAVLTFLFCLKAASYARVPFLINLFLSLLAAVFWWVVVPGLMAWRMSEMKGMVEK